MLNFVSIRLCGVRTQVEPSAAYDLWSEGGVALLGGCLYVIDRNFNYRELLGSAHPFSGVAHTGIEITNAVKVDLAGYGIGRFTSSEDTVAQSLHKAVLDNGSNMVSGLSCFESSRCVDHTGQRSVLKFFEVPANAAVRSKTRWIASHHRRSSLGRSKLFECCDHYQLAKNVPPRDSPTRWNGTLIQWQWFDATQLGVQMYDVNHCELNTVPAEDGSTYREHCMELSDWKIIQHAVRSVPSLSG